MDIEDFRKKVGCQNSFEAQYTDAKTKKQIMEEILEKTELFEESDFGEYGRSKVNLKYTGFKKLLKLVKRYTKEVRADNTFPYHKPENTVKNK